MIKIENLSKSFGKNQVLNGLNLSLDTGGIIAVLGPNGSGKTTLLKAILGMVRPDQGQIFVNEKLIDKQGVYRNNIDYLPQLANFPSNLKLRELLSMVKDLRDQDSSKDLALIERFGLNPYLNKKLAHLSGGTRQKVNLVLAFMYDSPLLLLDEPTSGLDPASLLKLKELLLEEKQAGKTIILSSHITSFVQEMADQLVFILEGKIYFKGSIQELKTQTKESNLERAIALVLNRANV